MHFYFIAIGIVGVWLFKTGKLNFFVKQGLQKAYASLFKHSEDFNEFVKVKESKNEKNVDIDTGYYSYIAEGGVLDTISYLDFKIDFALSFNTTTNRLKQSIMLSKGAVKHKFVVEGDYSINGTVVTFTPTEGELSVLPPELRESDIKFIVNKDEKGLLVSFNEDQFGKNHALLFEKN